MKSKSISTSTEVSQKIPIPKSLPVSFVIISPSGEMMSGDTYEVFTDRINNSNVHFVAENTKTEDNFATICYENIVQLCQNNDIK